ncbi:MAG TPA: flagellar basal body rod C-terminal domain-containing protein [Gemmatimonadales bacterium]|nr:flagellar basal body rod C-terminal domain-containing protein [Gemmatimonadales bacterium]
MSLTGNTITTALAALQSYSRRVDLDAQTIASDGLFEVPVAAAGEETAVTPEPSGAADLAGAMTDMLVAQRMFAAEMRVLQSAAEMQQGAVNLVKK